MKKTLKAMHKFEARGSMRRKGGGQGTLDWRGGAGGTDGEEEEEEVNEDDAMMDAGDEAAGLAKGARDGASFYVGRYCCARSVLYHRLLHYKT